LPLPPDEVLPEEELLPVEEPPEEDEEPVLPVYVWHHLPV
jgi:hypothetical protein